MSIILGRVLAKAAATKGYFFSISLSNSLSNNVMSGCSPSPIAFVSSLAALSSLCCCLTITSAKFFISSTDTSSIVSISFSISDMATATISCELCFASSKA